MAERRMFSRSLLSTDRFMDLTPEQQALYFHLCLQADDDGFISNAKSITRMVGLSMEALESMDAAGFVIRFQSGISVIRHWRMHNAIRRDRYVPTIYQEEFAMLTLDQNEIYQIVDNRTVTNQGGKDSASESRGMMPAQNSGGESSILVFMDSDDEMKDSTSEMIMEEGEGTSKNDKEIAMPEAAEMVKIQDIDYPTLSMEAIGCQTGNQAATQERIGKDRLGQVRREREERAPAHPDPLTPLLKSEPTREEVRAFARSQGSIVDPDRFYDYYAARNWNQRTDPILNWQAAFRCWENREKQYQKHESTSNQRTLPAQMYSQRDYSGAVLRMEDVLDRLGMDDEGILENAS